MKGEAIGGNNGCIGAGGGFIFFGQIFEAYRGRAPGFSYRQERVSNGFLGQLVSDRQVGDQCPPACWKTVRGIGAKHLRL